MKKVLIYSPQPLDGVSYYRQWGPLTALHDKINLAGFTNDPAQMTHWTWFLNYDVCLMSRPHKYNDFFFAEQCKKHGLPLWVDFDDALFHITPDNPVYDTFASAQSRKWISEILKMADVVTTCSLLQKSWFEKELDLKNVVHIPNALDDRLLKFKKPFNEKSNRVAWRGSPSHLQDLVYFGDSIEGIIKNSPKKDFLFYGIFPPFAGELKDCQNWKYAQMANGIFDFYRDLTNYNAQVQLIPLVDTFFNRVKSHLAWIDGTLSGSACLCPDFEEWDKPGMLSYRSMNKDDFYYKTTKLLSMSFERLKEMNDLSFEWQKDNILLSKINDLRLEIINNL